MEKRKLTATRSHQLHLLGPHLTLLRQNLLPLPIPASPPPLNSHTLNNLHQPLGRKLGTKQLLILRTPPKLLAQPRLHGPRMQRHRHRLLPTHIPQIDIETLRNLINRCFGRAIRIPASERIVADTAYACGHVGPDGLRWEAWGGVDRGGFFGEEGGEVF